MQYTQQIYVNTSDVNTSLYTSYLQRVDIQAAEAGIRGVDIRLAVVADSLRAAGNQAAPRIVVEVDLSNAALGNRPF